MRIAVLSDTHGLLRPEVMEIVNTCDVVLHGGDINTQKIADELSKDKPLYIVRGNNDKEWAEHIPVSLRFELDGIGFYMVHNKKEISLDLTGVDVVVFGHSHKYLEERKDGRLFLNPGSCGKRRFNQEITMAVLELKGGEIEVQRIDISHTEPAIHAPREKDIRKTVENISKGMKKGETIKYMAEKYGCTLEFSEQVCRIIATHPGVTGEGILNKMEVNRIQNPPCQTSLIDDTIA